MRNENVKYVLNKPAERKQVGGEETDPEWMLTFSFFFKTVELEEY